MIVAYLLLSIAGSAAVSEPACQWVPLVSTCHTSPTKALQFEEQFRRPTAAGRDAQTLSMNVDDDEWVGTCR